MRKLITILSCFLSTILFAQPAVMVSMTDHSTHFGMNVESFSSANESHICHLMKVKYIRDAVALCDYTSGVDNGVKGKFDSGLRVVVNINWDGNCQPSGLKHFPIGGELTSFQNKLNTYLNANAGYVWCVVIENEPYNRSYYNWSTSPGASPPYTTVKDYLAELAAAVTICHAHNVKIADGASHLDYYQRIINGNVGSDPERRADSAWHLYPNSFDKLRLDYVNCHYQAPSGITNNNVFNAGIIRTLTYYQTSVTHHPVISNEWHQEDANGTLTQAQIISLDTSGVTRVRGAHMPINMPFSGPGTAGNALSFTASTTTLNFLGTTYKNAVASGQ